MAVANCPQKHGLVAFVTQKGGYNCDICQKGVLPSHFEELLAKNKPLNAKSSYGGKPIAVKGTGSLSSQLASQLASGGSQLASASLSAASTARGLPKGSQLFGCRQCDVSAPRNKPKRLRYCFLHIEVSVPQLTLLCLCFCVFVSNAVRRVPGLLHGFQVVCGGLGACCQRGAAHSRRRAEGRARHSHLRRLRHATAHRTA